MKFKTKLAVYQFYNENRIDTWSNYFDKEYPRLSEILEVELDFVMLSDSEVIGNQVAIIDKEILEIKGNAMSSIAKLEQKRQELLAITHYEKDDRTIGMIYD